MNKTISNLEKKLDQKMDRIEKFYTRICEKYQYKFFAIIIILCISCIALSVIIYNNAQIVTIDANSIDLEGDLIFHKVAIFLIAPL